MTYEQILAFGVIAAMMAAFLWERFRYDVVACAALVTAVALGLSGAAMAQDQILITSDWGTVTAINWPKSASPAPVIKRFVPWIM